MLVEQSVENDLKALRAKAPELADSGLAASALRTARAMDDPNASATAVASCARALLDTMARLNDLVPREEASTRLDDITRRRSLRLGQ